VVKSATVMSDSVSGTVSKYPGIYNFYNMGASDEAGGGAVAKGLAWASKGTSYMRPWTNPYRSLVGGAVCIGKTFIYAGQNTIYLQKFNLTTKSTYQHQYMSNISAPFDESAKTAAAYGNAQTTISDLFNIPYFSGMPAKTESMPQGGKNTNNLLKSFFVKGHSFTKAFHRGDCGDVIYELRVPRQTTQIEVQAEAVSALSKVTGTGNVKLTTGKQIHSVFVTAQDGIRRSYKLQIIVETK
jgi:hypothetical protein